MASGDRFQLPKGWTKVVKSSVLHAVSLASTALTIRDTDYADLGGSRYCNACDRCSALAFPHHPQSALGNLRAVYGIRRPCDDCSDFHCRPHLHVPHRKWQTKRMNPPATRLPPAKKIVLVECGGLSSATLPDERAVDKLSRAFW